MKRPKIIYRLRLEQLILVARVHSWAKNLYPWDMIAEPIRRARKGFGDLKDFGFEGSYEKAERRVWLALTEVLGRHSSIPRASRESEGRRTSESEHLVWSGDYLRRAAIQQLMSQGSELPAGFKFPPKDDLG